MNEKTNLPELTALLAEKAGITKKEAETFLREFFGLTTESLISDDQVKIKDFGTFKLTKVEDRESVNVRTGERVLIPAHQKISFSPSGQISETINEPFALFEPVELETTFSNKEQEAISTELTGDFDDPEIDDEENVLASAELSDIEEESKSIDKQPEAALSVADVIISKEPEISVTESEKVSVVAEIVNTNTAAINVEEVETKAPEKKKKCRGWIACVLIFILLLLLVAGILAYLWYTNPQFRSASNSLINTTIASFSRDKNPDGKTIAVNETMLAKNTTKKAITDTVDSVAVAAPVSQEKPDTINTVKPVAESKIHTLQEGQRLTLLALREYGHKAFWVYIYEENKSNLESPHLIPIGTKLSIPPAQKYDIDKNNPESINKAKALAKKYE